MSLSTWYEVCVQDEHGREIDNSSVSGALDSAKSAVARFQTLYPDAAIIFVRQYLRGPERRFKVLHKLTVKAARP